MAPHVLPHYSLGRGKWARVCLWRPSQCRRWVALGTPPIQKWPCMRNTNNQGPRRCPSDPVGHGTTASVHRDLTSNQIFQKLEIYIIIARNIHYLLWNRGARRSLHNTYQIFLAPCIRCTDYLCDSSCLTHLPLDKMAAIFQTTSSNAFSWMKMYEFRVKISIKFVPKGPINNIPALLQIMAWRRTDNKPLSEPLIVSILAHISVTRPQWVNWHNCTFCSVTTPDDFTLYVAYLLWHHRCMISR